MPHSSLLDVFHDEVRDQLALDPDGFLRMRCFPQGRDTLRRFAIALHRNEVFRSDRGRYTVLSLLVGRSLASSLDLTQAEYRALRQLLFPQGLDHAPDETWLVGLCELEDIALDAPASEVDDA